MLLGVAAAASILAAVLAVPGKPEALTCAEPSIRVYKDEGTLELFCNGGFRRAMPATFGASPLCRYSRYRCARMSTGVPTGATSASCVTSSLVRATQPSVGPQ